MAVAIPFDEGDHVEKGDVLLELDDSSQRAQLALAQRELQSAGARRNQACVQADRQEQELARFRRLNDEKIVSQDVVDEARAAAESARAACNAAESDVERARSAVHVAQVEADKTTLRAPFSGVVAEISIELGEWTSPSPPALPIPPVIDLIDQTSIYVAAPMDEVDAARLEPGLRGRVTVDSHRGQEFWGTVVRVSPYVLDVEAQNRTVEIDVELDDETLAATLRPGTSADVEIVLDTRENALRIPTGALFEGNQVLVVEREGGARGEAEGAGSAREPSRLVARQIEVGLKNWNWTEVLSGLDQGTLIVATLDRAEIQPGAEVVIAKTLDAPRSGAAAAPAP
jgi:HlyD family secretion protein